MYIIPRTLLNDVKSLKYIKLDQPALYILLESISSLEDEAPRAYIGHAEDVSERINQHISDDAKSFFQVALVFVSTDHSINKADVQYLEYLAISDAKAARRYDMSNIQNGTKPHLSPDQLDVIDEFKDFVWLLTSFAGCRIFTPIISTETAVSDKEKEIFYLHWDGIEARGRYGNGDFIMLKGSALRKITVPSANPMMREKALKGICTEDDGVYVLDEDTLFSSPSRAAWIASGTNLNGWEHWRTAEGKSLNELYGKSK